MSAIVFFIGAALPAHAQFSGVPIESGGLYTALTRDLNNNLYVTRVTPGTSGATYEVEKYTNGAGTPAVIYTGLTHETGDYPWGLAVTSTGNVYISTDFTTGAGAIIELTFNSGAGTYTSSTFQTGRYFTALAVDAADNLYDTEYDAAHTTYAVVEYAANGAASSAGTTLYDNLKTGAGYTYPTGLAIAANGDVYVADAFSNTPSITDGGRIYKLTAASAYAASGISAGTYCTALAFDAAGDLFTSVNGGSGYKLLKYPAGGGSASVFYSPLHANGIYYPWGIAILNNSNIFAIDGDDGTHGGELINLLPNNALLSAIKLTPASVLTNTGTSGTTTTYTTTVGNAIASVTVTPTAQDAKATITVNGTAVTSGTASGSIALAVGDNTINTVVTAEDGITTHTYTITITRISNNASLSTIKLTPASALTNTGTVGTTTTYTASVSNATASVTVTPTSQDANATITVNGTPVTSGTTSGSIALPEGANTIINTVVTAQDGTTMHTYSITVTRAPSTNASLSVIKLTPASILTNTGTVGTTTTYTTTVGNATASVKVTPTAQDANATITVNGTSVASGAASGSIALAVGNNTINTVVTAQDGTTTHTYSITITRISNNALLSTIKLTPVSALTNTGTVGTTTTYTTSVSSATASVTVTPTAQDANATITVNGIAVTSGTASGSIALSVGSNTINTVVTAQDGTTMHTYSIIVARPSNNALLSTIALTPNSTLTNAGTVGTTTTYTATESNATTSVTVTPTAADVNATIKVNGTTVASGAASGSIALGAEGSTTTVTTVVTAQDGTTTHTYSIAVTRAPSSNALLNTIALTPASPLTNTGTFGGTTTYTASVGNATASVTVTATTQDANATITVNGTAVASGTPSGSIALAEGTGTTINTVVTAQDGVTTHTYSITVTRAPSSNAALSTIKLTPATALTNTGTTGTTTTYTATYSNATASATVTPTAQDANATITVNGIPVTSGTASGSIPLAVGDNTINTVVTAQDGVTSHTYSITITRAPGPPLSLYQPVQSISVVKPADGVSIENDGVLVHAGVSPNGDGFNDFLTIDGITAYPDNNLTIIDRAGALVYQVKGYDNNSKTFDGHSSIDGKMQQPGTYFYSLDYTVNGKGRNKTGYIILKY